MIEVYEGICHIGHLYADLRKALQEDADATVYVDIMYKRRDGRFDLGHFEVSAVELHELIGKSRKDLDALARTNLEEVSL